MRRFLKSIPLPFWCYFLPMVARTSGLLPEKPLFYDAWVRAFLPAALILLLISTNLSSLFKIGKASFATMLVGSLGIILGGPAALFLFRRWLPQGAWMGFGTLAGSWIGGSINMVALKEAIGTPNDLFSPMIFVDSVIAYSWMAILLSLAPYQTTIDRWNGSHRGSLDSLHEALEKLPSEKGIRLLTFKNVFILSGVAASGSILSFFVSKRLPVVEGIFTQQTWLVLFATTVATLLSLTPLSRLESLGASRLGTFFLYAMLLGMGAQADLKALTHFPLFVLVGAVWVLIHGVILFCYGRLFKIPLFFLTTASQANIGGVVSAPIVAACYEKRLASLGLLLAIFGNITGTYLGLLTAYLMRFVTT